ncbi:hypothetical protein K1719_042139 [Acacia pycnantha]|nr:hypothetical protein K1719_042139 [Acacia pycnantha]
MINLNLSCPLYVGQVNSNLGQGDLCTPVTFLPYDENNFVKVNHDMRVAFAATTTLCGQSTQWMGGDTNPTSRRRLIQIGNTFRVGDYSNYFRIVPTRSGGIYNMQYCPTQVCPNCRLNSGVFGQLLENGSILVALDGNDI